MQDMAYSDVVLCAKSFTELAIQNNLIVSEKEPSKTAENIAQFFNTLTEKLSE